MHINPHRILFRAAAVVDGTGVFASPGAVLIERSGDAPSLSGGGPPERARVIAAGSPQQLGDLSGAGGAAGAAAVSGGAARAGPAVSIIDLPHSVLIPALVNVHAHLDLSHIGPIPFNGDFSAWVDVVRRNRYLNDADIDRAVRLGVELSRNGGTAIIGDIAGISSRQPIRSLRSAGLPGVSFLEVFGLAPPHRQEYAIAVMRAAAAEIPAFENGVRLGFQPHAPYSCGLDVYRAAIALNAPVATHLAETREEIEFVQNRTGPIAEMLRRIGAWDDSLLTDPKLAPAVHPIDQLEPVLSAAPWIAAHVNYLDDEHVQQIARWNVTVAYCPRASAYFGHPHQNKVQSPKSQNPKHRDVKVQSPRDQSPQRCEMDSIPLDFETLDFGLSRHRYRDMMQRGINVALGTDSILCLDTPDRISVLDDMRLLYQRDGTDPITLLRMATVNGAKALGFDPALVDLRPGPTAGMLAIDVEATANDGLHAAMMNNAAPRFI